MKKSHRELAASLGLRACGVAMLAAVWPFAIRLHQLALVAPPRDASCLMISLATIAFLCGSVGSALLVAGSGLWEAVEVSERWRAPNSPDTARIDGDPAATCTLSKSHGHSRHGPFAPRPHG